MLDAFFNVIKQLQQQTSGGMWRFLRLHDDGCSKL